MNRNYIIIGLLVIVMCVLYLMRNISEHAGSISGTTSNSNEAVQNIAKVYSDTKNTVDFNNINVTNTLTSTNSNLTNLMSTNSNLTNLTSTNSNLINLKSNNNQIRLFAMKNVQITNPGLEVTITDSSGNTYSPKDWICIVAGIYYTFPGIGSGTPLGDLQFYTSIKTVNSEQVWTLTAFRGTGLGTFTSTPSVVNILAIPIGMVDPNYSTLYL